MKEYNKEATDLLHDQIFKALKRIEDQVTYTNGKLKKVTLSLVAVAAFAIGLGIVEAKAILTFIL
jgi:hypothetical protein